MANAGIILVVDDTPANLEVACETLHDAGYEVATAIDGDRALKRVQTYPPDLILLDLQMPGIDGFEVCRRLKADPSTAPIPIIFMTALSDTDSKVQGFEVGAVDYITKPFQERELLARVKTHLQLSQLTKTLEKTVAERTAALEQLQRTQLQMVQSEKMSALGQMVAGIAHEINNPVNFVHGNMKHLEQYTTDLLRIIQAYQDCYPNPPASVQDLIEEVDLEFLTEDVQKLLHSAQIGTHRVRQIVLSLRNFSRLDESEFKPANLHDGIDSTLLILQHRLKETSDLPEIEVIKVYDELPLVECYPAQLNQVFMNLLTNAIDALRETNQPAGKIWISTQEVAENWVQIAIADNGPGMPETVRSRIFDPFFTTKQIGQGTGLGLSISYQIVTEKHRGKMGCHSTPGEGTKFFVEIPISQSQIAAC